MSSKNSNTFDFKRFKRLLIYTRSYVVTFYSVLLAAIVLSFLAVSRPYLLNEIITTNSQHIRKLCNINEMILTYKHPILVNYEWIYPKDISDIYMDTIPLYNFVMKGNKNDKSKHTIVVNNIICATIGCCPTIKNV